MISLPQDAEHHKKYVSFYGVCLVAAQRAKDIANGAPAHLQPFPRKSTMIALQEIVEGKIAVVKRDPAALASSADTTNDQVMEESEQTA